MNKFAVVVAYFGKLKPSFALWYESARRNADVDFFVFTDDSEPQNSAHNVKWINFSLKEFNELAVKNLGIPFKITHPYKLCDFKPMYGAIYEDYLKGYEYWAFGDIDVIYGKISEYLQKINYQQYYKINFAGHLCFMKNVPEMNNLFKMPVNGSKNYQDVLESKNVAFDERDMNIKTRAFNKPLYTGVFSADLVNEKGMQVVEGKQIKRIFNLPDKITEPKNYHYQLFLSENGRIIRYYKKFFRIKKDEFCYMHYRLELPIFLKDETTDTFLLSFNPKGFYDVDVDNLKNVRSFMKLVKAYNNRKPIIIEKIDAVFNIAKKILKIKRK